MYLLLFQVDEEGNSLLSDYGQDLKRALSQKDRVSRVQSNPTPTPETQPPKAAEKQPAKPIPKPTEKVLDKI